MRLRTSLFIEFIWVASVGMCLALPPQVEPRTQSSANLLWIESRSLKVGIDPATGLPAHFATSAGQGSIE